jgi:hypothetical protein
LTPKGWSPVFGSFLKFGQAIVDAIFVQKISIFWWRCGLVLVLRCTNFYKILIFGLGIMPQKQNPSELRATWATKNFLFFNFFELDFFHKFLTSKVLGVFFIKTASKQPLFKAR